MRPILALLLAAFALPLALACGGSSAPTETEPVIEDISEAEILEAAGASDLTEEQRAALRAAFEEARAAIAELRASYAAGEVTAAEATEIARQIHQDLLAAIQSILTPEQLDRFQHQPPVPLFLTPEQRAAIAALFMRLAAYGRELQAQVENGEITALEARRLFFARAHDVRLLVCEILTPEQRTRFPFCQD
jgi:Spy/CpxP family protein refolding chaperone